MGARSLVPRCDPGGRGRLSRATRNPGRARRTGNSTGLPRPPRPNIQYTVKAESLLESRYNPDAGRAVTALVIATGLILLIACANLAALFAARTHSRQRDTSVRAALGAGRGTLVRGVLAEALSLGLLGGLAGLGVAWASMRTLRVLWPQSFTRTDALEFNTLGGLTLDPTSSGFILALALLTALLFGTGPGLRLARVVKQPLEGLRGTRNALTATRSGRQRGFQFGGRSLLVATQIAMTLVLLLSATLLLTSLNRLQNTENWFQPRSAAELSIRDPQDERDAEQPAAFHDRLLSRLRALPHVENATVGIHHLTSTGGSPESARSTTDQTSNRERVRRSVCSWPAMRFLKRSKFR